MSRISLRARRLRQDIDAVASAGRAVFRRPDGSTLALPLTVPLDAYLAAPGEPSLGLLSDEAIDFLAGCDPDSNPDGGDVERSLILAAKAARAPKAKAPR